MDIATRCLAIKFVDTLFLRANNETRSIRESAALCLHNMHADYRILCDDCHDDELRRSEECVSRCEARAGAEPQRQRKACNPANFVAFKAGAEPRRQRKACNSSNYVAFKAGAEPQRQRKSAPPLKSVAFPTPNPIKGGNQHAFR